MPIIIRFIMQFFVLKSTGVYYWDRAQLLNFVLILSPTIKAKSQLQHWRNFLTPLKNHAHNHPLLFYFQHGHLMKCGGKWENGQLVEAFIFGLQVLLLVNLQSIQQVFSLKVAERFLFQSILERRSIGDGVEPVAQKIGACHYELQLQGVEVIPPPHTIDHGFKFYIMDQKKARLT